MKTGIDTAKGMAGTIQYNIVLLFYWTSYLCQTEISRRRHSVLACSPFVHWSSTDL